MITYDKTLTKKLLAVRPEKVTTRKKKKINRKAIAKLFALNANAITNVAVRILEISYPGNKYLFKVRNRNPKTRCEISLRFLINNLTYI